MAENQNTNKLAKMLLEFTIANNTNITNIDSLEQAIDIGYEGNPDVFSIVNYLATLFASVPKKPYRKLKDGKYEEITDPSIVNLVNKPNASETLFQYDKLRYIFYLITGNSFEYCPKLQSGNNRGQLTLNGRTIAPAQYIEIISGGWKEPVKEYIVNYNYNMTDAIPANEMVHIKNINLDYQNGRNFYGISPVTVAANIIQAQNGGYSSMASTLKRGFPSGILTRVGDTDSDECEMQRRVNVFKKIWKRFYGKSSNSGEPIITAGDVKWIEMGFKNFKELNIVESSQHGLRVLCNVWNIPSIVMNDISGTTFNNQKEVRKAVYTTKIIPDLNLFYDSDNVNIWAAYGFEVWPDYKAIPELQADKKELADVINVAQTAGAMFTGNEIRELLEFDTVEDSLLNERYTTMGRIPASQDLAESKLNQLGVQNYVS